jgi:hypothetical protein
MLQRLGAFAALLAVGVFVTACGGSTTHTVTVTTPAPGAQPSGSNAGASQANRPTSGAHRRTPSGTSSTPGTGQAQSGGSNPSPSSTGTGSGSSNSGLTQHLLNNVESVHIVARQGPYIIQQGVVTGAPIGTGTVVMRDRLTGTGVVVSFTVKGGSGTVTGRGSATLHVNGASVSYHGTAHLTGGTGIYSRVRAPHLTVVGSGVGGNVTLHVTGTEWY